MRRLCDLDDVKRHLNIEGRWTDDEVYVEIEEQTDDIYQECGDPLAAMITYVDKDTSQSNVFYLKYFLGENRIYGVERVFVGTATKRELVTTDDYTTQSNVGMIKFTTSTVGGLRLSDSDELLVYYVPNLFAKYCALRTAKSLLEKMDTITGGTSSRELEVIDNKLAEQKNQINLRLGIIFSSENINYDSKYGINLNRVMQQHDKNDYVWKEDSVND